MAERERERVRVGMVRSNLHDLLLSNNLDGSLDLRDSSAMVRKSSVQCWTLTSGILSAAGFA